MPTRNPLDPLAVVSIGRINEQVWATVACGCAVRLNQDMETTGQAVTQMLRHAEDVANGERGGCLPRQPGTRINPGRTR